MYQCINYLLSFNYCFILPLQILLVTRCSNCGKTLIQVYYNRHEKTKSGNSMNTPIHLANLYYCEKENLIYHSRDDTSQITSQATSQVIIPVINMEEYDGLSPLPGRVKKIPCLTCEPPRVLLKKIYYNNYISKRGYPQHLNNLFYCTKEHVILSLQNDDMNNYTYKNNMFDIVLDLNNIDNIDKLDSLDNIEIDIIDITQKLKYKELETGALPQLEEIT